MSREIFPFRTTKPIMFLKKCNKTTTFIKLLVTLVLAVTTFSGNWTMVIIGIN